MIGMDFIHAVTVMEFSTSPQTETACGLVNPKGEEMIWFEHFTTKVDERDRCPTCNQKINEK